MAATENSANTLKINIVADANPAKQALADVGKAAIETKEKIEGLGKAFSDSTKRITDLTHDVNTLRTAIGQKSFGLTGMEDSARRIEVHLNNAIGLANRLAKTSFANNGFAAAEKSIDRIIAKMREPIDAFRVKEESISKAEKWLETMRAKFAKPINVFEISDANSKKIEDLLTKLEADRVKRGEYIKSEIELLREQRANYRAAQSAAKDAADANKGMARLYKSVLNAQAKLFGTKDLKALTKVSQVTEATKTTALVKALDRNTAAVGKAVGGAGVGIYGMQAVRSAYDNIIEYQQRKSRVSAWNLSPENQVSWEIQRKRLMNENKLITNAESESMMMAAASSLGKYDPKTVGGTIGAATKYAQLERIMGYNKSEADDIVKNYYGVAEARQVTGDVQKVLDTFKTVFNITTTTAGKISVADIETIMRNMGPGAATISDEGLLRLLAYAEQIKVAGKGSSGSTGAGISTVGTNVKMLQLMAMGKPSSINAKKSLAQLGLMDDDVYGAYDRQGNLKANGDGTEGSDKAADIARIIFERGDLGQVLEKVYVKGSKELAQAGAYKKDLAQTDPVRWVAEIAKLIDAYVTKSENRHIYFGEKGRESQKKGESDQDFRNRLSDADMISAQTTFWAKTGLSQRVLTALSTFSNVNFQLRSEHMMDTARNQKSADDLMKEQAEMGNLTLASDMLKKSIIRLTESFEPMTSWVGKAAVAISGLIDKISQWVSDYQVLAGMSAGWFVMRSLIGSLQMLGGVFDDVALKELRTATAAREMERSQNAAAVASSKALATATAANAAQSSSSLATTNTKTQPTNTRTFSIPLIGGISRALDASYIMVSRWTDKVKVLIGTIGVAFSKCVTLFGAMWLAVDVASIFAGWLVEFTDFGKKCKAVWDQLVDSISNSKIYLNFKYDDKKYRTAAQNQELDSLEKKLAAVQAKKKSLTPIGTGDDEADKNNVAQSMALDKEEKDLQEQIKGIKADAANKKKEFNAIKEQAFEKLDKGGLIDAYANQIITAKNTRETAEAIKQAGVQATDSDAAKQDYSNNLRSDLILEHNAIADTADALKDKNVIDGAKMVEDFLKSLGSLDLKADFIAEFGEELEAKIIAKINAMGLDGNEFRSTIRTALGLDQDTNMARARGNIDVTRTKTAAAGFAAQSTINDKDVQDAKQVTTTEADKEIDKAIAKAEEEAQRQRDIKAGKKTLTKTGSTRDQKATTVVERWFTNQKKIANRYDAKLMDGGDIESWEETRARMKDELTGEILSGKFNKIGQKNAFMRKPENQGDTVGFTEADIDWTGKDGGLVDGKSANDVLDVKTYNARRQMFVQSFGELFRNATKNLESAKQATEDARIAMDEFAGEYANSAEMRSFDRETQDTLLKMKKNGTGKKDELEKYTKQRAAERAEIAKRQLYSNQNSDRQTVENSQVSKMTSKQALTYNYEKSERIAKAQYDQTVRQIQKSIKQGAITQQEGYTLLSQYEQQYLEAGRARYQDYYDDLTGYSEKYLNQKIEDWQDLGKHMQNMQDTIMDGFVSANEKWLDGDKNSWRDYCNDILKMWRNMAMKMGYSELLGGITKGITGSMTNFLAGAFNKEKPQGAGAAYDFGNSIWKWVKGDEKTRLTTVTQSEPLSNDQMASNTANSITGSLGYGSYGWNAGGNFGLTNNSYANNGSLTNAGVGNLSGTSSLMTAGSESSGLGGAMGGSSSDEASANLSSLASNASNAAGAFGNMFNVTGTLAQAFGANQETVQSLTLTGQMLNMTSSLYNTTQQVLNALGLTQTQTQGGLEISLATLQIAVTETISTFIDMWTEMQAAKAASAVSSMFGGATASANGNIMTEHGPLPLKYYSNGGIAKKAQVSIFGEGRTPEAYVPLPDGRSIPVTMKVDGMDGETASAGGNQIAININITNNSGSETETESSDGSSSKADDMRTLANNIKAAVKNEIYNQSRPGGLLYNPR